MKNVMFSLSALTKTYGIPTRRKFVLIAMVLVIGAAIIQPLTAARAGLPARSSRPLSSSVRPDSWAVNLELRGLPNLHRMTSMLYRGAQPEPRDVGYGSLKKLGVRTVISLRNLHNDERQVRDVGLAYVRIPFNSLANPKDEQVVQFLRLVTDSDRLPVFVHCRHGADRTGTLCAIYRIVVQGWSKDEAIREMTEGGFNFHADNYQAYVDYVRNVDVNWFRALLADSDGSRDETPNVAPGNEAPLFTYAESLDLPGLPNLHRMTSTIYRGAQPEPPDVGFRQLKALGVKTVVNLRTLHEEIWAARRAELDYVNIKFPISRVPTDGIVIEFLQVTTDSARLPIFVYSDFGSNRAGLLCAVYRIVVQGWSKEDAIREMTEGGFGFNTRECQSYVEYLKSLDVERLKRQLAMTS